MSTAARATGKLTWAEFLDLPESDELKHAELIDGEVVTNPPTPLHQRAVLRIASAIDAWTRQGEGRGEATMEPAVQIGLDRGYLPDVAWYREERCQPPEQAPSFTGPPDLAAEVLSPSTRTIDALRKRADYARIGVGELWLIDPEEPVVQVYRRPVGAPADAEFALVTELRADDVLTSPLLAGLRIAVGDLVRR
jgi:Uma2 family endonuclease